MMKKAEHFTAGEYVNLGHEAARIHSIREGVHTVRLTFDVPGQTKADSRITCRRDALLEVGNLKDEG